MKVEYVDTCEKNKCDFCEEVSEDNYSLRPSNDEEWNTLGNDFEGFADTPVIYVCENCLQGYCGAVNGDTPTVWFREVYPELIKQKKNRNARKTTNQTD